MNINYWMRHPFVFVRRVRHFFYERNHPDEPFLAPSAVRFLDKALPRNGIGLEWGSGRSTSWFASRLRYLVAVEHDPLWAQKVSAQLDASGLKNVDYRVISLEHPSEEPTRRDYIPVPQYVAFTSEFPDEYFDFIEIDGHYRQACVVAGCRKLKPGGLLLIDDTNWIPIEDWGVPESWKLVHQSTKINTMTSIWRRVG